jgi:hypothetical protein
MARLDILTILAAVFVAATPTSTSAQDVDPPSTDESVAGLYFALHVDVLRPPKNFRDVIGRPVGLGGHLAYPIAFRGPLSLAMRLDGFWVRHDYEERAYNVELAREFGGGLLGFQLATSRGWVRPYITGGAGTTLYYTIERFEDCTIPGCEPESDIKRSDWEGTVSFGAGIHVQVIPSTPADNFQLQLHLGVADRLGGTPDIRALAASPFTQRPRAHYRVWQIGLSVAGR